KQCLVGDLFQVVEWRLEEAGLPDEENRIRARTIRIQGVKTLLGGSASAGFADQATMEMQDDASGRIRLQCQTDDTAHIFPTGGGLGAQTAVGQVDNVLVGAEHIETPEKGSWAIDCSGPSPAKDIT